jgi:hypothetical protein
MAMRLGGHPFQVFLRFGCTLDVYALVDLAGNVGVATEIGKHNRLQDRNEIKVP